MFNYLHYNLGKFKKGLCISKALSNRNTPQHLDVKTQESNEKSNRSLKKS